jgi:hypothetical protein
MSQSARRLTAKPGQRKRQIARTLDKAKSLERSLRELGWHEEAERVAWMIGDWRKKT